MTNKFISISSKINIGIVLISLITLIIISSILYSYNNTIKLDVYSQVKHDLVIMANEKIKAKMRIGLSNAISISNDKRIKEAFKTNNNKLAIESLQDISSKMKQFTQFKNIKIHLHTKDNKSFLRSWDIEKYGDDLSQFRKTIVSVNNSLNSLSSFEQGRSGLLLRSIIPIIYDKKHYGSLEVVQGVNSIAKELASMNKGFLILMDKNIYNKLAYKFKSNHIKAFDNYIVSQKFIDKEFFKDVKKIDTKQLLKDGYLIDENYFYTAIDIEDFKYNKLGILILSKPYSQVSKIIDKSQVLINISLMSTLAMAFIISISLMLAIYKLVIQPLKQIEIGLTDFFIYLQGKDTSHTMVQIDTNDEFGKMSSSINENISVSIKLHKDIYELNTNLEEKIHERTLKLEEQKETFETIYQGSKDSIAILDMQLNFIRVNQSFIEMFGFMEDELIDTSCLDLTIQYDLEASKKAMLEVLSVGYIKDFTKGCYTKDKKVLTINMSMSLINNPQRILISARDVTKHKLLEQNILESKQKAEENTKSKSEFLANMSHEIRTPMNGILGMTNLTLKTNLDEQQKHYIQNIDKSAKNLLEIINDILDFSKMEAGKITIERIDFDLVDMIDSIIEMISYKTDEKGLNLNINYENLTSKYYHGDSLRIGQIITNLLTNAIKFTDDGKVDLTIFKITNERFRFEVLDTGIGLTKQQQLEIFKSFSQADGSTTRTYGGSGLGLSISKQLTELMNGKIWVESTIGIGSKFIFEIDLVEILDDKYVKLDTKLDITQDIKTLMGSHILMCEDNIINQEIITGILEHSGINIDIANNGKEGLKLYTNNPTKYELILMDIQMPIMDGYKATKAIRKLDEHIPIIAMSANAMDTDIEKTKHNAMNEHLSKPINVNHFFTTLLKYISKKVDNSKFINIDTNIGLTHLLGNQKVYTKILNDFVIQYQDLALEQLDNTEFKRTIHTIKGLSANIGALSLHKISLKLDKTHDKSLLAEFYNELHNVIDELQNHFKVKKIETVSPKIDTKEKQNLFKLLEQTLHTNKPKECQAMIIKIETYKFPLKEKQLINKIKALIDNYKFKEAIKLLENNDDDT